MLRRKRRARTNRPILKFEAIEQRTLMAADALDIYDVNADGFVDHSDASAVVASLNEASGQLGTRVSRADVNGDGFLNSGDVLKLINQLNRTNSARLALGSASETAVDTSRRVVADTLPAIPNGDNLTAAKSTVVSSTRMVAAFQWNMEEWTGPDFDFDGDGKSGDIPNVREYIHPENGYRVNFKARTAGAQPATYDWIVEYAYGQQIELTGKEVSIELHEGNYYVTLRVTDSAGGTAEVSEHVRVDNILVVSMGDSSASGEGAPNQPRPVGPIDGITSHFYRAEWADGGSELASNRNHEAHRSIWSAPAQAAYILERQDPHTSVTFLSVATSGARLTDLFGPTDLEPNQTDQVRRLLESRHGVREIDSLFIGAGVNDMGFGDLIVGLLTHDPRYAQAVKRSVAETIGDFVIDAAIDILTLDCFFGLFNGCEKAKDLVKDVYDVYLDIQDSIDLSTRLLDELINIGIVWVDGFFGTAIGYDEYLKSLVPKLRGSIGGIPDAYSKLASSIEDRGINVAPQNVYITGYPDPALTKSGGTPDRVMDDTWLAGFEIDRKELEFAKKHAIVPLNDTLRDAAHDLNWNFIDLQDVLAGRGYAASDNGIATWTESVQQQGYDFKFVATAGVMHPNRAGGRAMAERMVDAVQLATPQTLDDEDPGYATTEGWQNWSRNGGYLGDYDYVTNGTGSEVASWTFSELPTGTYRVWTTWQLAPQRPTNAPYAVYDDTQLRLSRAVNQTTLPDDLISDGSRWEELGVVHISSDTLRVELTDAADSQWIIADAVRIERIGGLDRPVVIDDEDPGYATTEAWQNWSRNGGYLGDYDYVTNGTGSEVASWTFTGLAEGTYRVWTTWQVPVPQRPTNAPYAVYDDSRLRLSKAMNQTVGPNDLLADGIQWEELGQAYIASGTLRVDLSDAADSHWIIADAVRIQRIGKYAVIDDESLGYTTTEGWANWSRNGGFLGDYDYVTNGTGREVASWTFTGLAEGTYRVWTTWQVPVPQRPTNAPYAVYDDSRLRLSKAMNQTVGPDDLLADGIQWEELGQAYIASGTLRVDLSDVADSHWIIADAVRIERIGDYAIIDDESLGYTTTEGWANWSRNGGFLGDYDYVTNGTGSEVARWTFTGLAEGTYRVWTTWQVPVPQRPTNAPYAVYDDSRLRLSKAMNQTVGPNDLLANGIQWEELGQAYIASGTLRVDLSDAADSHWIIADAVRIQRIGKYAIIDDEGLGYTTTEGWANWSRNGGFLGDYDYVTNGTGSEVASWTFTGLTEGTYRVWTTWQLAPRRPSNAPYTVYDDSQLRLSEAVNQTVRPGDLSADGIQWEELGLADIASGTLRVDLSDVADSHWIVADAVRIQWIGN